MLKSFFLFLISLTLVGQPIKIGCIIPLTGPMAKFGEMDKKAYLIALEEINEAGGIGDRPIAIIYEDDQGKPEVAMAAAEKLITRDKVPMIIGEYSSSCAFAVAGVCERYKTPFLNICGAADKITQQGWDYVFRMNPPASEYPSGFKEFLKEVGYPEKIAILFENTLFGTSSAKALKDWCDKEKIEVVMYEPYESGAIDFKPMLIKVKAKNPDVMYMVSYIMDAILLIRQSKELDINPKVFVGGAAGFTMPSFLEGAGDAAEFVISITLWSPESGLPKAKDFYKEYEKRYGVFPDYHGAEAYASLFIVADVLKRAKSLDTEEIKKAFKETSLTTPFGLIKFEDYQNFKNQNRMSTLLLQVQNGQYKLIWPKEIATSKYIYPTPKWSER
jgi:branched-chain amino acid transport system substrate-binding protein